MPSCTDPLRLNDNNLFKVLKNDLPKNIKDTQDLLEIRDDILYVWNPEKCCIFTLNVAATRGKSGEAVPYQTLQPTDPPIFEITNLVINETATQLALWGNLGIVLVELPRRWGKDNAFQGGKDVISCVNHNLNGRNSHLTSSEIRQVRWHPGSANDSHLLVLTSDNTFQLYESDVGNVSELVKTWKVGPTPHQAPKKKALVMESLGETAVDFDFITPSLRVDSDKESYDWNKIEWSILVLKGDGNVLIVRGNILNEPKSKPVVMGSLSIFPAADDNYGLDSCSIMCIQTTPPVVAIATCTGVIYHAILIQETEDDIRKHDWHHRGSNYSLHAPEEALYVIESVELELGLLFTDEDKKYSCSIKLHRDKENKSRYFCTHNAGIHMVSLPLVAQLEEFLRCRTDAIDLHIPTDFVASNSQYLVSTRTKYTGVNEPTPTLGFGLLQQPCAVLIALLHSGTVVDLSVVDLDYIPRPELPEKVASSAKKVVREPFDVHVRGLLKPDSTSQPITKLGPQQKLSGKEYFQLLDRATTVFRTSHFVRHDKVRIAIDKKVRSLKALKAYQLKELNSLMSTKEELQRKAQQLAERYEDIKEQQEKLAARAEKVLRLVNDKELSSAERADAAELKGLDDKVKELKVRLEQVKKNDGNQTTRMELDKKNEKRKELILNPKQEAAIKSNLSQMARDIAAMISKVKFLEEELNGKLKAAVA